MFLLLSIGLLDRWSSFSCLSLCFRVGADVEVNIEDVSLAGRVQVVFEMDHIVPFPHMKTVSVTFLERSERLTKQSSRGRERVVSSSSPCCMVSSTPAII